MGDSTLRSPHVNARPRDRYRVIVAGDASDPADGYHVVDDDGMPVVWFAHFGEAWGEADRLNADPLAEPEADEIGDDDRRWLASHNRDWHADGPMDCGLTSFDDASDYADEIEIERHLAPRRRAMRLDAEDEARLYGWIR